MPSKKSYAEVPVEKLRWRLDPATLPFKTTDDIKPLKEIIGQKRGVEAFQFGIGIDRPGYNLFVTGAAGSGRMSTVRKLLQEISKKDIILKETDDQEVAPARVVDDVLADQDFARNDGRDKTLREVAELVVIVAGLIERVFDPVAQRHLGIRVMTADHQDDAVNQYQDVGKPRKREALSSKPQDCRGNDRRHNLEQPGRIVVRPDA